MNKVLNFVENRKTWAYPYALFLLFMIVLPLFIVAYYSFTEAGSFTLRHFDKLMLSTDSINTFIYSIGIAMITTIVCLLLGYPCAYFMARKDYSTPKIMVMLFILPMWINQLLRTLATVALFDFLHFELGQGALIFGMVYDFLPFMIYPIYNTLRKQDMSLSEAARDLGATAGQVFYKVTLPLSMPGVISGILMVFMPTISTFAIAEMLTMNNVKLFGSIIQENINAGLLNYGSALSLILLVIVLITSCFGQGERRVRR